MGFAFADEAQFELPRRVRRPAEVGLIQRAALEPYGRKQKLPFGR